MRIISGSFKGQRFNPPIKKWPTRPTTDISKEGLFNILQNRIDFKTVVFLDLFGGTGNITYEFISRGCKDATYVDNHYRCISFVKRMSSEWKINDRITIIKMNAFKFMEYSKKRFDFIFADPPYALKDLDQIPLIVFGNDLLEEQGTLVLEHNGMHNFKNYSTYTQSRKYGETIFSFFKNK